MRLLVIAISGHVERGYFHQVIRWNVQVMESSHEIVLFLVLQSQTKFVALSFLKPDEKIYFLLRGVSLV